MHATTPSRAFLKLVFGHLLLIEGLGKTEMFQLARIAVDFIFAESQVKMELIKVFESAARTLEYD